MSIQAGAHVAGHDQGTGADVQVLLAPLSSTKDALVFSATMGGLIL